jgi:hypothetical protein
MAAVTYSSSGTLVAELDSSLTITLPATLNADDIVLICSHYRGPNTETLATPTHGTLTFAAVMAQSGGNLSQQRTFWARCAGGEGGTTATVTKTGGGTLQFQAAAHRFLDCKTTGNPYDGTAGATQENTGAGATVTIEAMTISDPTDALGVITYLEADDDVVVGNPTNTADATYTIRDNQSSAVGLDARSVVWSAIYTDTSPSATTATQPAADQYSVQQFVLLPVVAPPATFVQLRDPWPALQAVSRGSVW